jgi:hypothetical protein
MLKLLHERHYKKYQGKWKIQNNCKIKYIKKLTVAFS